LFWTYQVALTAAKTHGRFGLGGALVCLLTLWFCKRIRLDRMTATLTALVCSFIVPSVCFGVWELPQLLVGHPIDWKFVAYYFFRYLPERPGAGGLCGGISFLLALVITQLSRVSLVGHDLNRDA
jgi:hypothetical protein